jgi:spore maturation protein CgeB
VPDSPSPKAIKRIVRNLTALDQVNPALGERIRLPVEDDHVLNSWGNRPERKLGRSSTPIAQSLLDYKIPLAVAGEGILLFGVGLGEGLSALLKRFPDKPIIAWERDPWLLRLALSRRDYTAPILSGQLQFALGPDLVALQGQVPETIVAHPLLRAVYAREWEFLHQPAGTPCALICDGELFVRDLDEGIRELGFSTYTWEVSRLATEELSLVVQLIQPRFVAAINFTSGLTEACLELKVPLAIWEVDPCLDRPGPVDIPTGHVHICTYRKENMDWYRTAGFERITHLPLAANVHRRVPTAPDRESCPPSTVCFIGNSTTDRVQPARKAFLEGFLRDFGSLEPGMELLEKALTAQLESPGSFVVPEILDAARPGWRSGLLAREEVDPAIYVGEIATAVHRIGALSRLAPLGVRVWGDAGWKKCEPDGVTYMGRAGQSEELNRIYSNGAIHLDIGRLYQPDIVTMRVFDVLACGGFLLADRSEALEEMFTSGVELECWTTLEELQEKIRFYQQHPEKAQAIALAGRARVLRDHTIRQRLQTLLSGLAVLDLASTGARKAA